MSVDVHNRHLVYANQVLRGVNAMPSNAPLRMQFICCLEWYCMAYGCELIDIGGNKFELQRDGKKI